MRKLIPACAAIATLLIAAPVAGAATPTKTETASSGAITATLTYQLPETYEATGVTLAITRDGAPATVADGGDVAAGCEACNGAIPVGGIGDTGLDGTGSLTIADLQGDGEPEVIVDLFTGGAHCCSISVIYGWDATTASYTKLTWQWGDPSYRLKKLGSGPATQLLSADDRFAYTFCAYACSAMPPVVYEYNGTTLVDVTKQYPAVIRADATSLEKGIRSQARSKDGQFALPGLVAPLCADYYLLGQGAKCKPLLSKAKRSGWLSNTSPWKGGQAYVNQVLRLMTRWGYR